MSKVISNRIVFSLLLITLIFSMGCSKEEPIEEPEPDSKFTDYKGVWNSTTASTTLRNVGASTTLEEVSDGKFEGDLNFPGFPTTGPMTIEISGTTITSFKWTDTTPSCSGDFIGTGTVKDNGKQLFIELTGDDCKGNHIGTLVLNEN